MPEATEIILNHKELVELLVKSQGIHEGIWGLFLRFGIEGANIGPSEAELNPVAVVPVLGIGLQKFDKETNISVDAAKVNPKKEGTLLVPPSSSFS